MDYRSNSILLVDDEPSVLNAISRLLRPLRCQILSSVSPIKALEILEEQRVDIVISDMRMPEMGGECFLELVAKKFPDTERIVMTGYSDAQATIDAINKGKISRFLLKPWNDEQVKSVVTKGFELAALKLENQRLQDETVEKNIQLEKLNQSLEAKVQERTLQIKEANSQLKGSYRSVVRMFSTLTARRLGVKASSLNLQLNQLLVGISKKAGIEGKELKQLYYAWQLRNIGKLSFSDELIVTPYLQLTPKQQRQFHAHPLLAQAACMMVKPLYSSGKLILQSKEYLDGSGYPRGLKEGQTELRAQIICVMNDYVELINGLYDERHYSTGEAISYLQTTASERYNQSVVTILKEMVDLLAKTGESISDQRVSSVDLKIGMKLTRDLISETGILLLSVDQVLDEITIERIREMEFNLSETFSIYVSTHN